MYYGFEAGSTSIFIVLEAPQEGQATLHRAGCIRELSELDEVRTRIDRAKSWRTEYLERVAIQEPETFKAAGKLDTAMQQQAISWPSRRAADDEDFGRIQKEAEETEAKIRAVIDILDPRVVTAALALDWLRPERWSKRAAWESALMESFRKRWAATAPMRKQELERVLSRYGESKTHISNYMASLQDGSLDGSPQFPIEAPDGWNHNLSDGETLTTDFVARTLLYDRGGMFALYGMRSDRLGKLQPERVAWLIPSMLGSADRDSSVAWQVIEEVKGMHFVDELLRRQMNGEPKDLRIFAWAEDRQWGSDCLHAAFERARKNYSAWGRARLWRSVAAAGLVDQRIVDEAVAELEEIEKRSAEKDSDGDRRQFAELGGALARFFDNAKVSRGLSEGKMATAKELRDWFSRHPEKSGK